MSEWSIVALAGIWALYKLADRWLDSRDEESEHHSIYSDTERHDRGTARDDSERRIPDIQIVFRGNDA